jgi:acyl carrier protein
MAALDVERQLVAILDEVLGLGGRARQFGRHTHLLGSLPELDSMAVVALITTCEERLGIVIDDDEIDGSTFATLGTLTDFVAAKLQS